MLSITTKSDLVTRDIPLLQEIGRRIARSIDGTLSAPDPIPSTPLPQPAISIKPTPIKVWVTPEEKAAIAAKADAHSLSASSYLRRLGLAMCDIARRASAGLVRSWAMHPPRTC